MISYFSRKTVLAAVISLTVLASISVSVGEARSLVDAREEIKSNWPTGGEKVFDCQVSFGDFQEIRVYKMEGESYWLKTLDNVGSQHAYWLNDGEWPSKTLNVPCPREATKSCGYVYVDASSGDWMYDLGQSGYRNIGNCR